MVSKIIKNLTDWSLLRVVRLVVGISLIGQGADSKEWILIPIGLFFLYQVLFNVGCSSCQTDECSISE